MNRLLIKRASAATAPPRRPGVGAGAGLPLRRTTFALAPDSADLDAAVRRVMLNRGCQSDVPSVTTTSRTIVRCVVEQSTLCNDPPITVAPVPLLCVLAGSAVAPPAPAVSYGYSAAELLLDTLARIASAGRDIANRSVVLAGLTRAELTRSPIGPIHFTPAGAIVPARYSIYTVKTDGQLTLSGSVPTH